MKKVCIKEGGWKDCVLGEKYPLKGDIVTVSRCHTRGGILFYFLEEFGYYTCWNSKHFRDLDYDFVEDVLSKIKEEELTV